MRHRGSKALTLAALAAACVLPTAAAAVGGWSSLGPDGGQVTALAVHPSRPAILYAAAESAGVFRSDDGGASWHRTGPGLPIFGFQALAGIAIDPGEPETLYVPSNQGLFRSIDGGGHWQSVGDGIGGFADTTYGITTSPTRAGVVFLAAGRGLFVSRDRGDSWRRPGGLPVGVCLAVALDPRHGDIVYASVSGSSRTGLYRSSDGGETWAELAGAPVAILAVVVDPRDSRRLYASNLSGVWKSRDGGASWTLAANGLNDPSVAALVMAPSAPATLYAATPSGVFVTRDGARHWSRLDDGSAVARAHALAVSPVDAGTAWVGLWGGAGRFGLWSTRDGGRSWQPAQAGMAALRTQTVAVDPFDTSILYALGDGGLYRRLAGGGDWVLASESLGTEIGATALALDPFVPGRLFLAALSSGGGGALWRSLDRGDHWQRLALPPGSFVGDLLVLSGGRLVASGSGIMTSSDGGDSWTAAPGVAARTGFLDLASDQATPPTIYAVGYEVVGNPHAEPPELRLLASTDAGASWAPRQEGLAAGVSLLAADPGHPGTVYAVGDRVYRTTDGLHWSQVASLSINSIPRDVLLVPGAPTRIYVATQNEGILRSTDDGVSWQPLLTGLVAGDVGGLAVDPRDSGQIYAALSGGGIAALSEPAEGGCAASATALCLHGERFRVEVDWRDFQGNTGRGQAANLSDDTGTFWFFAASNVELVVKLLDGRDTNGAYWLFYGALSTVEYHVTVTDTLTGAVRVYSNPSGRLSSVADTRAFLVPAGG